MDPMTAPKALLPAEVVPGENLLAAARAHSVDPSMDRISLIQCAVPADLKARTVNPAQNTLHLLKAFFSRRK